MRELAAKIERVVAYSRVSTDEQVEKGLNLEEYEKRLRAACESRGWELVKMYTDPGESGRTTRNRPQYQAMMTRLREDDSIGGLLVYKMDRIHRNSRNFMRMMEDLKEWDKEFISHSEAFDTSTAMGRFVMDIIARIAQLESEVTGERVKMGKQAAKAKGFWQRSLNPTFWHYEWDNPKGIAAGGKGLVIPTQAMHDVYRGYQKPGEPTLLTLAARNDVADPCILRNVRFYEAWLTDSIMGDTNGEAKVGGFLIGKQARHFTPKLPQEWRKKGTSEKAESLAFIRAHKGEYRSKAALCRAAGIGKSTFYRWESRGLI